MTISKRVLSALVATTAALLLYAVPAPAAGNEVLIGYSLPLTGRFSTEASDVDRGYRMWADEVNARGGLRLAGGKRRPVKLVSYDDTSKPNNAIQNYQRLITKDKVDLLLSSWGSGHNFAISAVTEKYKYPTVLTSAAANPIFGRGFKHIFSTTQMASTLYNALAEYLDANKDRFGRVAIAYENFIFTQVLHKTFLPKLKKSGIKVVVDEKYPLGSQDFTGMLTKVKAAKPDAFLVINIMPASIYITRQMGEVGLKTKMYAVNIGPMFSEEFIEKLGSASENILETGFWHHDLPYEGASEFYERYKAKYGKTPSTDAAYAYIGTQVLEQAIQQAGTVNREKLTRTLHNGKFNTILGPYDYDERGVNKHQISFLAQVQNGKRVIAWPSKFTKNKVVLPNR